jgi:hypothetical protein
MVCRITDELSCATTLPVEGTLIAPDIIEAILCGSQLSALQLEDPLKPLPASSSAQHSALCRP